MRSGSDFFLEMMILSEFEAGITVNRKAVIMIGFNSLDDIHVEDRKCTEAKILGPARFGPDHYLPLRHGEARLSKQRKDLGRPRASGDYQPAGLIGIAVGPNHHLPCAASQDRTRSHA